MEWRYGKQDWKTLERGEENCYLVTNGLGGFSSQTIIGSSSRNDHALFMACVKSPNHRINMIHRMEEQLSLNGKDIVFSSQRYKDEEKNEEGYVYQSSFCFKDYPVWTYLIHGVEIIKTVAMEPGKNTLGIRYEIHNRTKKPVKLTVCPQMEFVSKGSLLNAKKAVFTIENNKISSNGLNLYLTTNGRVKATAQTAVEKLFYAYDIVDGRNPYGNAVKNHEVSIEAEAAEDTVLDLVYAMTKTQSSMDSILSEVRQYRSQIQERAGFTDPIAQALSLAAEQFISHRESTGGLTILAGFPFFEDWGRDTMIAILGCCIAGRQFEAAKSILRTFMMYCKKGLMPNLFPEGTNNPGYNTVDAALLFVIAVYEYYMRTKEVSFVEEAYPVIKEIITWYQKGTDFGIKMDEDGLIMAGKDFDQVTWMDVRVGEILPTPRHGKPVEINAYWYNCLRIMEEFCSISGRDASLYAELAEKVAESFEKEFWLEEGYLKDVISGTKADKQLRCNQIWAISLPFSVLPREKEKQVVETVFEKLYTPYGLRTLSMDDEEFCPEYGGAQLKRDLSYHQGTVWTFPLGGYYLAYLKVNQYSEEAKAVVRRQLEAMESAMREGCVGQLPEIYDGFNPVSSKGCFAQAWSTGEILRVYDALR